MSTNEQLGTLLEIVSNTLECCALIREKLPLVTRDTSTAETIFYNDSCTTISESLRVAIRKYVDAWQLATNTTLP